MSECPARGGGDEWHPQKNPSPLAGEGRVRGKINEFSPPPLSASGGLILPRQGGGESEMPRAEARGALLPDIRASDFLFGL